MRRRGFVRSSGPSRLTRRLLTGQYRERSRPRELRDRERQGVDQSCTTAACRATPRLGEPRSGRPWNGRVVQLHLELEPDYPNATKAMTHPVVLRSESTSAAGAAGKSRWSGTVPVTRDRQCSSAHGKKQEGSLSCLLFRCRAYVGTPQEVTLTSAVSFTPGRNGRATAPPFRDRASGILWCSDLCASADEPGSREARPE